MKKLSRRTFHAGFLTSWLATACSQDAGTQRGFATSAELESLMERLDPADVFIISDQGFFALLPPQLYTTSWSVRQLRRVSLPEVSKLRMRSRAAFQLSHASSAQVDASLKRIAQAVEDSGHDSLPLADLRAAANAAVARIEERDQVVMMWAKKGGFHPEMFLVPVPKAHMEKIYALFLPEQNAFRAADAQGGGRFNETELGHIDDGLLTEAAVHEARAMRLATMAFELAVKPFREDIGSWLGNIPIPFGLGPETIVCTDESLTMTMFLLHLMERGILHHFKIDEGRLGHRWSKIDVLNFELRKPLSDHFGVMLVGDFGRRFVLDSWVQDGGEPSHFASLDAWNAQTETGQDLVGLPSDPRGFFDDTTGVSAAIVAERFDSQTEPRPPAKSAFVDALANELSQTHTLEGLWHVGFGYLTLPSDLQYDVVTDEHLEDLADHYEDEREIDERFNDVTLQGQVWVPAAADAYRRLTGRFAGESIPFESLRLAAQLAWNILRESPAHGVHSQLPWIDADHRLHLYPLFAEEAEGLRGASAEGLVATLAQMIPTVRDRPGSFEAAASIVMALDVIQHPEFKAFTGRLARVQNGKDQDYAVLLDGDHFGGMLTSRPEAALVQIDDVEVLPAPAGD